MRSTSLRLSALIAIAALVAISALASGALPGKPVKVSYLGVFNVLEAWEPFGLLGTDEPSGKQQGSLPLVQITDSSGKALAAAQWEGDAPKISKDGKEWTITLSATIWPKKHTFELTSTWSGGTKLVWGRVELSLSYVGDAAEGAKYRYLMRFPGAGAWIQKDGKAAAIASIEGYSGSLSHFLAIAPADGSATFKSKQISKTNDNKEEKKIFFVEAQSVAPKAGEAPKSKLMSIFLTQVSCWEQEPVISLAGAMASGRQEPDLRIFGTADKQAVSPGESLEYTYYIFNAGMDEATELNITLPVTEKTSLIAGSIHGSPGTAKLLPSGDEIEVFADKSSSQNVDKETRFIQWKPGKNIMPGEVLNISFSVVI